MTTPPLLCRGINEYFHHRLQCQKMLLLQDLDQRQCSNNNRNNNRNNHRNNNRNQTNHNQANHNQANHNKANRN